MKSTTFCFSLLIYSLLDGTDIFFVLYWKLNLSILRLQGRVLDGGSGISRLRLYYLQWLKVLNYICIGGRVVQSLLGWKELLSDLAVQSVSPELISN